MMTASYSVVREPPMAERKLTLRISEELHAEIAALAEEDLRSVHSEIIVLLREAIAARKAAKKGGEQ